MVSCATSFSREGKLPGQQQLYLLLKDILEFIQERLTNSPPSLKVCALSYGAWSLLKSLRARLL